jgi:hypothetical protein
MSTDTINEYLLELVQETSKELLKIYFDKPHRKTLLKFPEYRNGKKRISEQELRFVITNLHGQFSHPWLHYSVETPTKEKYNFSGGKNKRSAASDLSFYHNEEKVLNIELKAHQPGQKAIDKDIKKLVTENCNGAWIHILENEDKGTVETLFKKFKKTFQLNRSKKPISFHILILETQILLSRKGKEKENDYSNNIFNIDYSLWKNLKQGKYQFANGKPTTQKNPDEDWQIDKFNIK